MVQRRRGHFSLPRIVTDYVVCICKCNNITCVSAERQCAEHQAAVRGGNEPSQQPTLIHACMLAPSSCIRCLMLCLPSWHAARRMLLVLLVGIHHKRAYSMCHWRRAACGPQGLVFVGRPATFSAFVHVCMCSWCSLSLALLLFLHSPLEPVDIIIGAVRISSKTLGLLLGRRSALRT